jgi:hypothetical protein
MLSSLFPIYVPPDFIKGREFLDQLSNCQLSMSTLLHRVGWLVSRSVGRSVGRSVSGLVTYELDQETSDDI